jgi:hypothetical protein
MRRAARFVRTLFWEEAALGKGITIIGCMIVGLGIGWGIRASMAQTPKPTPPARSFPLSETQRLRYQVLVLSVCADAQIKPAVCSIDWQRGTVSDMTPQAAPEPTK